jgi:hypothetical protein
MWRMRISSGTVAYNIANIYKHCETDVAYEGVNNIFYVFI